MYIHLEELLEEFCRAGDEGLGDTCKSASKQPVAGNELLSIGDIHQFHVGFVGSEDGGRHWESDAQGHKHAFVERENLNGGGVDYVYTPSFLMVCLMVPNMVRSGFMIILILMVLL
jgi:hypothetical protein